MKNRNTSNSSRSILNNKNNNKMLLKKDDLNHMDFLNKLKNELRKLMLRHNIINIRLNYINNNKAK